MKKPLPIKFRSQIDRLTSKLSIPPPDYELIRRRDGVDVHIYENNKQVAILKDPTRETLLEYFNDKNKSR